MGMKSAKSRMWKILLGKQSGFTHKDYKISIARIKKKGTRNLYIKKRLRCSNQTKPKCFKLSAGLVLFIVSCDQ